MMGRPDAILVCLGVGAALRLGGGPEERRTRRLERQRAEHVEAITGHLQRAGVDPSRPVGGGTLLTEDIVVVEGAYQADYHVERADGASLGIGGPVSPPRSGYHACRGLRSLDGTCVLMLLIAARWSSQADVVLAADGAEVVRLEKPSGERQASPFGRPEPRLVRGWQRLGLAPRTVVVDQTSIGTLAAERRVGRLPRRRIVYDRSGTALAAITMTLPLTGIDRCYVVDLDKRIDERLRAVALLVPFLWDSSIIAWQTGG
jgi:hypothetical protein